MEMEAEMKKISKETAERVAKAFNKAVLTNDNGEIDIKDKRFIIVETGGYPYGFGDEISLRPVNYRQGMQVGEDLIETVQGIMKQGNVEETVNNTLGFLVYGGYGLFELVSETEEEIVVRVHNSFEVDSYKRNFDKPATQPVCHFTRGILSEVFSELKGKPVKVEETTCAAMSGSYCEFKIVVSEE